MSDPHPGDFNRAAPAPSSLGATAAEAEEEEREPGALAPRQLPGDDLSEAAGASEAFATPSVDFGFGNSWSHIPIPIAETFDAHRHPSPHHDGEGLHESPGGGSANPGGDRSSRAAGRHSDDDKFMSDSHPAVSVAARKSPAREAQQQQQQQPAATAATGAAAATAAAAAAALSYAHDASSASSLAEVEQGERIRAHGSSVSGRIGVDTPHGSSPPGEDGRSTTPTEQVSLPDDIYGAARVSEYWHGVSGLSSLASTYVYDDIWAGDGGLNPREDIMSITGWAAGGGHAATQERGGGGEAVAEIFGVGSHREGRQSQSPARRASVSSSGDDERMAGSEGRGRGEDGNSSSGSSGGKEAGNRRRRRPHAAKGSAGGGHDEDGNTRGSSEGRNGRLTWNAGSSWGTGGGRAHSSGTTDRRRVKDGEGHASKKRRTPSPDAERTILVGAGMGSADSEGASAAAGGGGGSTSREQQALQEAEVIRWCQKVSSARAMSAAAAEAAAGRGGDAGVGAGSGSSGDEERFFAGRVLDPAPRPPPRRHGASSARDTRTASLEDAGPGSWGGGMLEGASLPTTAPEFVVQHNGGNGSEKSVGGGGGDFRGDPSRGGDGATVVKADEARTALSAAGTSPGCSSGSQPGAAEIAAALASASTATAAAAFTSTPAADFSKPGPTLGSEAIHKRATAGAAQGSTRPSSSSSSSSSEATKESFFACHTLEPKPRLGGTMAPLAAPGGPRGPGQYHGNFGGSGDGAGSVAEGLSSPLDSGDAAGPRRLIPRQEEVLAAAKAAAAKAAAAVSEAESSSSMDWQVRPEAMMGFFTTVGGVSPPSLLRPGRRRASGVRARAPSPGAATARRGDQLTRVPGGERGPNPRELPSSGSGGGGDGGGALPDAAAGGGIDAAVAAAAARQRAAEMAQGARLSSDPGSVSSSSNGWNSGPAGGGGGDGEGVEGGGNSSWGW